MREWNLTLTVEDGMEWMSLNDRTHYRPKAAMTKLWRTAAHDAAIAAGVPTLGRAIITGYIYKNRAVRYDPHNLFPTLKAAIDGIVDACVLEDDDYTHLRAAIEHGGIDRTSPPHIVITIREDTRAHMTTFEERSHPSGPYWWVYCTAKGYTWEKATASLPKAQKARDKHETTGR